MSKEAIPEVMRKKAGDHSFLARPPNDAAQGLKESDLALEGKGAFSCGGAGWTGNYAGKRDNVLMNWPKGRLQPTKW